MADTNGVSSVEAAASSGEGATTTQAIPVADALADGLLTLLTPMVDKCDDGIERALKSQAMLSQEIDRVASELQSFLTASTLPSLAPHAQRLADIRRRVASANSTMAAVQARLTRIEAEADRLERQEGLTLQRGIGTG